MKQLSIFLSSLLASSTLARNPQHANKGYLNELPRRQWGSGQHWGPPSWGSHHNGSGSIMPQNKNTTKFAVDGTKIPDVDFDIGESYAGLLPISSAKNASELYFWFFPSAAAEASDEIIIWLNGGPGCSSLEGLLQENGPFLWQYGTYKPVKNVYSWTNLSSVVYIEQPAGTGFSRVGVEGPAQNELDVASQFVGFWKNFVDTFGLHGRKVFITGESYAGYYVPYIADGFHNQTNKDYYNLDSIMFYDPSVTYDVVENDIPSVPFVDYWSGLFSFNQTFMDDIHTRWETCGYKAFYEEALVFPPKGKLPTPPNVDYSMPGCEIWNDIYNAAILVNPCWDVYQVATTCPLLWDVLGFPGSIPYLPDGTNIYFNRSDVQKAINAPLQEWDECTNGILQNDNSPQSGLSILPRVIEKNKKTIIGHGQLDFILLSNGTLMMIQNMTWNGQQGFQTPPSTWDEFFVPYHPDPELGDLAGAGVFGSWHTERGFTFVTVDLSGHMVPQYAPSAAYRQVEFMLGRIDNLGVRGDFTTQSGDFGNNFDFITANTTHKKS